MYWHTHFCLPSSPNERTRTLFLPPQNQKREKPQRERARESKVISMSLISCPVISFRTNTNFLSSATKSKKSSIDSQASPRAQKEEEPKRGRSDRNPSKKRQKTDPIQYKSKLRSYDPKKKWEVDGVLAECKVSALPVARPPLLV